MGSAPTGPDAADGDAISIAVVYPLSGDLARVAQGVADATVMAFEDVNEEGGIQSLGGARINPVLVDIQSDVGVTRTETERALAGGDIVAVTGCYASTMSLVASEVTERAGVPFVTGSISDELTDRGFESLFQVSPKGSHFGETQVRAAYELGQDPGPMKERLAIIYEETDYGTSTSEGIRNTAEELGLKVVLFESYPQDIADPSALITRIERAGADVLFPVSYLEDAILIIRAMAQRNLDSAIFGGGAGYLVPEFVGGLGELSEYVFSVASWNWDINYPGILELNDRYTERSGEAYLQEHAGEGYAMGRLLADALERAGSAEPSDIRDALAATDIEPPHPAAIMPGGRMQFDETGWNQHVYPVLIQWEDGLPRTVFPVEEAREEVTWPVPGWDER
ncbi:MAG: ABC transporter substrate-binding protein [Egibacteraceae bacterium]